MHILESNIFRIASVKVENVQSPSCSLIFSIPFQNTETHLKVQAPEGAPVPAALVSAQGQVGLLPRGQPAINSCTWMRMSKFAICGGAGELQHILVTVAGAVWARRNDHSDSSLMPFSTRSSGLPSLHTPKELMLLLVLMTLSGVVVTWTNH